MSQQSFIAKYITPYLNGVVMPPSHMDEMNDASEDVFTFDEYEQLLMDIGWC